MTSFRTLAAILLVTASACAPIGDELPGATEQAGEPADQPAPALPTEQPTEQPEPGHVIVPPQPAPARCLTLTFDPACVGQWADPTDRFSRWRAHPDTGIATFPCEVMDGQCGQSWYRDARCVDGAEQLEATCFDAGGTCALAGNGHAYCVAAAAK